MTSRTLVQMLCAAAAPWVLGVTSHTALADDARSAGGDARSQEQRPREEGHFEAPGQDRRYVAPGPRLTSPSRLWTRNGYVSVQVNVDENGDNIVGDAANEPSIAVDPTNPKKMVIGWRQFDTITSDFRQAGWGYTTDGGHSWTFPGVIEPGVFRSDPVLDFDAEGNFYYNSLTAEGWDFWCHVFKSTDGGQTWDDGTYAFGGDKQWMCIDRTDGIGHGNIYANWTYFYSICDGDFTRSYDGGETFLDCLELPGGPTWGTTTVGPDGELYITGEGYDFVVVKSTTMQDSSLPPEFDSWTTVNLGGNMEFGVGPNPGGLLGQVWIATDHSDGPTRGNVYVLCSVDPSGGDPLDVMFARSEDGGQTWSNPVRVNDDPPGSDAWQWFSTMSVSPNGRIDVIWNDTRNDPGGYTSELYYAYSDNTGQTWSVNEPISPSFDPHIGWPQQNKIGDYYDMISDETGAHVAYSATFNGEQDVYYLRLGETCSDAGTITLDRAKYACESTAGIAVNDCGLNQDDEVPETVEITIDSDSEPAGEAVILTETGPATSEFEGEIGLSETDAPGVLRVAEGDTVTATYIDDDDGQGGSGIVVTYMAVVDCTAPVISDVETVEIQAFAATVAFATDESATGTVRYGLSCDALTESESVGGYEVDHAITVSGLTPGTTYYYAVDAEDEAGNLGTDDAGGLCYSFVTESIPLYFTEIFESSDNDLSNLSLVFTPDGSSDYYAGCVKTIDSLPTDPTGGAVLTLADEDWKKVTLDGGEKAWFYGTGYGVFYVGSNGYVTFVTGDTDYSESLIEHFQLPRIAALFDDLSPNAGGEVSWKQLDDRVVVTWLEVPEWSGATVNTFQIEMYFDGMIVVSYLTIEAKDGLAGLSAGTGLPTDFVEVDLSALGECVDCPADVTGDGVVDVLDLLAVLAAWGASGGGLPEDITGDGIVDVLDLLEVLGAWGPCG